MVQQYKITFIDKRTITIEGQTKEHHSEGTITGLYDLHSTASIRPFSQTFHLMHPRNDKAIAEIFNCIKEKMKPITVPVAYQKIIGIVNGKDVEIQVDVLWFEANIYKNHEKAMSRLEYWEYILENLQNFAVV